MTDKEALQPAEAKILVVDDEKGMRDFLAILLRGEGYAPDLDFVGALFLGHLLEFGPFDRGLRGELELAFVNRQVLTDFR